MTHHPISPLDGRYADRLAATHSPYFSEKALMQYRCRVELLYALALDELGIFAPLSTAERTRVQACLAEFTEADYQAIKAIEAKTRHDVKAVELFLREKTQVSNPHIWHFALTSEDVNNLAYALMLKGYWEEVQRGQWQELLRALAAKVEAWAEVPFPARTHGQKASPTTAGKELAVFLYRFGRIFKAMQDFRFAGKLNGAVGNFSAMLAAFPQVDWLSFSQNFITQTLGLNFSLATTQIEDHDTFAAYFNQVRQWNNILLDLDQDCWLYISRDLFKERSQAGEVGSSTMPHKVNPINFENSEGNLQLANALLAHLSDKLCRSRMQRDLSDSTVQRNMGVALAHGSLALGETLRGLAKLQLNEEACLAELEDSPELLAEPIQTMLKTAGVPDPYELLKAATRGQRPSREMLLELVHSLNIPAELRQRIEALSPRSYIGDAPRIARLVLAELQSCLGV